MTIYRKLILGSAASLLAIGAAQAADLPVKAKAVEYVRICSLYGAGFFYIPGTDTCIKLGGYLRVDTTFNGGAHGAPAWSGDLGQQNRFRDQFVSRSRMALAIDTRTATEYGVVRTFGQGDFQFNNFGSTNPAGSVGSQTSGLSSSLLSTAGGGYVAVEFLFIQFAGFTFGKSASAYASPWHGAPGNIDSNLLGGHTTDTGVNNIQYEAQFGNGVSGTVGLEDPTVWNRTAVYNLGIPERDRHQRNGIERLRRRGCPRRRRQNPHRSGLGPVPALGQGASRECVLQHSGRRRGAQQPFRNQRPP